MADKFKYLFRVIINMATITIEHVHNDILSIKKELEHLRTLLEEDYELAYDVIADIKESKARSPKEMISHEQMRKEFGE